MREPIVIILALLILLTAETAKCDLPAPRTLDQKVQDSELIILGMATLFGGQNQLVTNIEYTQKIRLNVKAVLWPPSFTNTTEVVFNYFIVKTFPNSWSDSDYTNTPGVFFLVKGQGDNEGGWDPLPHYYNDWMEPTTNTLGVLLSIAEQKGVSYTNGPLQIPAVPWPWNTRYDGNNQLRDLYLRALRDGYFDALAGRDHLLMFNPNNDEDKARVLGFADGQLAGDDARRSWLKKFGF